MKTTITEIQILKYKEEKKKFAVFAFDNECDACNEFIPQAVEELKKHIEEVYYIDANDMALPAQTLPCLYMYKNGDKPVLRVGNAPMNLVSKDFEQFYG